MKKKRKPVRRPHYTLLHEIGASATDPLPEFWRNTQLLAMWDGLAELEKAADPGLENWRVCSDACNLMETLVEQGEVEDTQGLLQDAIQALAEAGIRHRKGHPLRLSGPGMQAVRAVLEDYSEVIGLLPARTMIRAHRLTERRNFEILAGKSRPNDIAI